MKWPGDDWKKAWMVSMAPGEPLKATATESEIVLGWVRCQVLRQEVTEQAGWEYSLGSTNFRYRHFSFCGSWE